jgi:hypothetical protein
MSHNRLFDLRALGREWDNEQAGIDEVFTPEGELLKAASLLGSYVCSDLLADDRNLVVGVAVAIAAADLDRIAVLFNKCSSQVVRILSAREASTLERYKSHAGWAWLEVLWSPSKNVRLVEVQTLSVIWYSRVANLDEVVAMGLEDITYILKEANGAVDAVASSLCP